MLKKDMRKKLSERKWLNLAKRDTNPTQTLLRLRRQAVRAIDDLVILANKLPEDTQAEIFSYKNLEKLIHAIFGGYEDTDARTYSQFESRKAHISYLLANAGISHCIPNYMNYVEQDPVLNRATVEKLRNAADICEAIALKMLTRESSYKVGLVFLFNWSKITPAEWTSTDKIQGEDNMRLIRYLSNEFGYGKMKNVQIVKLKEVPTGMSCCFDTEDDRYFECWFDMDDNQRLVIERQFEGSLIMTSVKKKKIFEENLLVKKEDGNLLVFKKISKEWLY
jgi:hypothetical protein